MVTCIPAIEDVYADLETELVAGQILLEGHRVWRVELHLELKHPGAT